MPNGVFPVPEFRSTPTHATRVRRSYTARWRGSRLDQELARGADPATSPELERRAAELRSPEERARIANRLVTFVGDARRRMGAFRIEDQDSAGRSPLQRGRSGGARTSAAGSRADLGPRGGDGRTPRGQPTEPAPPWHRGWSEVRRSGRARSAGHASACGQRPGDSGLVVGRRHRRSVSSPRIKRPPNASWGALSGWFRDPSDMVVRTHSTRRKEWSRPGAKKTWTFASETMPVVAAARPRSWRGAERACAGRASGRVWPTSSRANAGWTCMRPSSWSSAAARLSSRPGSWRHWSTRGANEGRDYG